MTTRALRPPTFPDVTFLAPTDERVAAFLSRFRRVVAGTGHRPDKLPHRSLTTLPPLPAVVRGTPREARDPFGVYTTRGWAALVGIAQEFLSEMGADAVVGGGALCWDQVVLEAGFRLGLPCLLAVPFETQASLWPEYARAIWLRHAQAAEVVVCVTPVTTLLTPTARSLRTLDSSAMRAAMTRRNDFMVASAHAVLALHNGSPGGTANCMRSVLAARRPVENAWARLGERYGRLSTP
ncbi:hypothetical protein GCM10008019_39640 [Deinococcus soli (ex Cha et al. 2016)]|nr:hypothetical protein GCM10008019_39640 [Deinococcus soli (ex Cha et al. 2016)]